MVVMGVVCLFQSYEKRVLRWVVFSPLGAYGEFPDGFSRFGSASQLLQCAKVGNRSESVALVCEWVILPYRWVLCSSSQPGNGVEVWCLALLGFWEWRKAVKLLSVKD